MLIVVGIIALLVGLIVPAIASVQKTSKATASQSNLKQWGSATINYTSTHKERLPWEGLPAIADMPTNLADPTYWANGVSLLAGGRPYSEMVARAVGGDEPLPVAPQHSIFCDPGAVPEFDEPWSDAGGYCFFSYVPNMRLNDVMAAEAVTEHNKVIKIGMIPDTAATVLMMELRARPDELPSGDPYRDETVIRNQSDWRCFGNHYFDGGHVVMADGHTQHILNDTATRSAQNNRDPSQANGDWNKPGKLIWNPLGAAPYTLP